MPEQPGPDAPSDIYGDWVDDDRVEQQRETDLELARGGGSDTNGLQSALSKAMQAKFSDAFDSFADFIRPATMDVVPSKDDVFSNSTYDFDAMVSATIYYIARDDLRSWHDLESFLRANRDTAQELGFETDIPDHTTFSRTWSQRFHKAFRDHLRHIAQKKVLQARRDGIPIPDELAEFREEDAEPDPKEITENQKQAAIENIRPMVFDQLAFDRADNAHYHRDTFLDLFAEVSRETDYMEKTVQQRRTEGDDVPWSQTVFNAATNRSAEEWEDTFRQVYATEIEAAKGAGLFDRPAPVYIDTTIRPFYVRSKELPEGARGGEPKNGTYYGYHHTTISAHVNGRSVLLASYQFNAGENFTDAVQYLVQRAEEFINIREVCMDSAFCSKDVLEFLDDRGHKFILQRARRGNDLKRRLVAMSGKYDESTLRVGKTGTRAKTRPFRLLAEPNYDEIDGDYVLERAGSSGQMGLEDYTDSERDSVDLDEADDRLWRGRRPYITNIEEGSVQDIIKRYNKRWTIETKYRVIKEDFLGKTTSRDYAIRTFYWLFACMLYNAWVLLDVFVRADAPDDAELPDDRPVMPARTFAKSFVQAEYG